MAALPFLALAAALWSPAAPPDSLPPTRPLPAAGRSAQVAPRGMVASAHPLASEVGARVLAGGGNAADAAIAVQAMLAVVEPQNSGPGGGCFILLHDMVSDSLYAIDGREESPGLVWPRMFLDQWGQPYPDAMTGGRPVGVPGTLAAMSLLHADFGRLPLAALLAPAIAVAETGFAVPPALARAIRSEAPRLAYSDAAVDLYFHADGAPYREGERFRNPDLARTLRAWAADSTAGFLYRGKLAEAISAAVLGNALRPGRLQMSDLANYRAVYRRPLRGSFRGTPLAVFPPPTSGGVTLLEILGLYATQPPLAGDLRDPAVLIPHLDRLARASRPADADRADGRGDPDWSPQLDMPRLASAEWVAARAPAAFDPEADLAMPAGPGDPPGHTTHFSIVDVEGSMLACTSTIETTFGAAVVVPGWGFPLNNELTDFNWVPVDGGPPAPNEVEQGRRPRAGALHQPAGAGGKRPRSSMCPVIVYDVEGRPAMALGSPGGARIIGTVANVLLGVLEFGLPLAEAVDFPRLHCRNRPVEIETFGWNAQVVADAMAVRGWPLAPLAEWPLLQGNVNAVRVLPDGRREGACDPRQDGAPVGN